ncbi:Shedu immune nuclease family protein [Elizabethkingia anophelis]|uniref:Shedu immune nuclease family protein n=1 Tax=Elizabethkingia anophelis TaxID=1117645 RepID=UPI0038912D55
MTFFFHKDIDFKSEYFIAETKLSVLKQIDELVMENIYIGGKEEKSMPLESFIKMIDEFPTTYEKKMYAEARVSSIIKNYFETTKDSELKFQKYLNTKTSKTGKKLQKIFQDYELQKFQTIQKKLNEMLKSENEYSEDQWQNEILEIILFLYPKYIFSFKSVYVKADKNRRRFLDYMLVDSNGNIDVIEIKKPFENAIMTHSLYRGNYTPHKDLTGTIMQLEKYIYHLSRYGSTGERNLTSKYKDQLPEGLEIKIINPKGIIIMGRDINLNAEQRNDFEIVRRKYKNVVDIITYDDLLRRLNYTIEQIQRL